MHRITSRSLVALLNCWPQHWKKSSGLDTPPRSPSSPCCRVPAASPPRRVLGRAPPCEATARAKHPDSITTKGVGQRRPSPSPPGPSSSTNALRLLACRRLACPAPRQRTLPRHKVPPWVDSHVVTKTQVLISFRRSQASLNVPPQAISEGRASCFTKQTAAS